MTVYTDAFTAANIYPSEISYSVIALTALNPVVMLSWPEETSASADFATRIIDVTTTNAGYSIVLPDASMSGTGNTILFNNKGADTFAVYNNAGIQVLTVAPSTLWQIYLTNNTSAAGLWGTLQYGASVSIANASALAGTGIVAVGTVLSPSIPVTTFNTSFAVTLLDRAKFYNWTGVVGTLTLPQPTNVGNNWFIYLRNSGTGAIKADAPGSITIDGASFLDFQPQESAIIASDGVNFYTIGFGQNSEFAFSYKVVDVTGGADYTLSGNELNQIAYRFIGVLSTDIQVIVPATTQQYWINNRTTGAFTLTVVSVGAGDAITVAQGESAILYCDSTDMIYASTAGISLPISLSQGGTSAASASGARINLGGTSVGIALFTAVTQRAAWTVLGAADGGSF